MDARKFLAEFRYIASAPNGVQKVRDLVLQLAIAGDLTERIPGDIVASDLLLTNKEQQAQLIARGELKRQLSPPKIDDNAIPWKLPEGWLWCRLGDVTNYGQSSKVELQEVDDDTWVLELEDIEKGTSRLIQRLRAKARKFKSTKNRFSEGNVLYGKLRPYLDKVLIADEDGVCTTEIMPISFFGGITPGYLRWYLKSPFFITYATNSTHGMNLPRMGTEEARNAPFPLPPLAEQLRIVAKIDELMSLCDKLEVQQQKREALCKQTRSVVLNSIADAQNPEILEMAWHRLKLGMSLLIDEPDSVTDLSSLIKGLALRGLLTQRGPGDANKLLERASNEQEKLLAEGKIPRIKGLLPVDTRPFELPAKWQCARLHQVAEAVDPNPSHRMPRYVPRGVPLISTENFSGADSIDFSIGKQVSEDELVEQIKRYEIREGSFAFSRIGTIGKTCHLPIERNYCISHALVVISPLTKEINEKYLRLVVSDENTLKQALEGVKSIGVPDLGMAKIRNFLIPIPPLEEQIRIVHKVDEMMGLCSKLKQQYGTAMSIARDLGIASVHAIAGTRTEDKEKMKAPKTELVSKLRIGVTPTAKEQAPLSAILLKHKGELSAKSLWQYSGLEEIDVFYQQLKLEMANGWIVQPEAAYMRELEVS